MHPTFLLDYHHKDGLLNLTVSSNPCALLQSFQSIESISGDDEDDMGDEPKEEITPIHLTAEPHHDIPGYSKSKFPKFLRARSPHVVSECHRISMHASRC